MKMNYDNYEWLMFELLEGNLSEQDELKVIKQIEEDEFFFKEWKLFKQTKIHKDDAIIFPDKLSLLKPISQAPVRTVPVFGIAASIVIAVMIGIFWPSVLSDSETISTVQNLSEQQKITPKSTNDIQLTKSNTPRNSTVKAEQLFLPNSNIDVSKLSYRHETRITEEFFSDAPIKLHEQINIEYIDVSQPVWIDSLDGSISVLEDNISVAQSTSKPKSVEKLIKFVTNRPIQRIRDKTSTIVKNMKNSNLKIKPNFDGRNSTLGIYFESDGYIVMANLKPFKKQTLTL